MNAYRASWLQLQERLETGAGDSKTVGPAVGVGSKQLGGEGGLIFAQEQLLSRTEQQVA